jgi:DNA-nicking Smr family endonuclease
MKSMKSLADLKDLGQQIKKQREVDEKARALEEARVKQAALEANLFRLSVGEVQPIKVAEKHHPKPKTPLPIPFQHIADERAALKESLSDEFDAGSLLDSDENLSFRRPGIGEDVTRRLRKGEWVIQAQLDLHGMRRDQARESLGDFLRQCMRKEIRCVRIIHGKGLGSVNKEPVLKNKVKNWLIQKDEVLAFSQATPVDGGAGALIVLLRSS